MQTWQQALESAERRGIVTSTQASLIKGYLEDQIALRGPAPKTLLQRVWEFSILLPLLGDAPAPTSCKSAAVVIRGKYSVNHQRILFTLMKSFARYLGMEEATRDIKVPGAIWDSKKSEDLLTREEAQRVINAGKTVRDRAILAMMYDGSLRPIEVQEMLWGDLNFDEYGAWLTVRKKTKFERTFRLTLSIPYLMRWRENCPVAFLPENPVFVSEKRPYPPLGPYTIPEIIRDLKVKENLPKLKPSIFRPSKFTHEAEDGYPMAYIAMKGWGNMGTRMIRIYVKPSRDFMNNEALTRAGIREDVDSLKKVREDRAAAWKPHLCPTCGTMNPPGMPYCGHCMMPLTEDAGRSLKSLEKYIDDNKAKVIAAMLRRDKELARQVLHGIE